MNKLLSTVVVAALALVSVGSFAASHGGAMKDGKPDCTKQEKMDDKMKAECKKMHDAAAKKPAPAASK